MAVRLATLPIESDARNATITGTSIFGHSRISNARPDTVSAPLPKARSLQSKRRNSILNRFIGPYKRIVKKSVICL